MEKISLVIPVYNGEGSVEKCISSIVEQTYKNLEIIIVDDGSKDQTLSICQKMAAADERIKVVHQDNQGVSVARNNGIASVSGTYVMFVDADDYLDADACMRCLDTMHNDGADIVVANKIFHIGNRLQKNVLYSNPHFARTKEDKELFILDLMTTHYDPLMNKVAYLSCGVTAKLFKTDLIRENSICFQEDCRFGEDVLFNLECFQHAEKISYIDFDAYHFCVNSGSSTHKFRNDWNKSHEIFMDGIDAFLGSNSCMRTLPPDFQGKSNRSTRLGHERARRQMRVEHKAMGNLRIRLEKRRASQRGLLADGEQNRKRLQREGMIHRIFQRPEYGADAATVVYTQNGGMVGHHPILQQNRLYAFRRTGGIHVSHEQEITASQNRNHDITRIASR